MGFVGRRPRFLAKSTLWSHPVVAPLLIFIGAVPVYRRRDGAPVARNLETFARCREVLAAGGTVALFPEGGSHNEPAPLPLKTGAARIALETEARAWRARPARVAHRPRLRGQGTVPLARARPDRRAHRPVGGSGGLRARATRGGARPHRAHRRRPGSGDGAVRVLGGGAAHRPRRRPRDGGRSGRAPALRALGALARLRRPLRGHGAGGSRARRSGWSARCAPTTRRAAGLGLRDCRPRRLARPRRAARASAMRWKGSPWRPGSSSTGCPFAWWAGSPAASPTARTSPPATRCWRAVLFFPALWALEAALAWRLAGPRGRSRRPDRGARSRACCVLRIRDRRRLAPARRSGRALCGARGAARHPRRARRQIREVAGARP